MNPAAPEGKKPNSSHVVYFSIAAFLLLAMALTWPVDPSVDYIVFGAAAFFLFLGFWTRPRVPVAQKHSSFHKGSANKARPANDLFTVLNDLLSRKATRRTPRQQDPVARSGKKLATAVSFFIFFVFFIIIAAVIMMEKRSCSG